MRFSTLAAFAAATAPLAVSAKGTLGFALGIRKADGSCKAEADFLADFKTLKDYTTIVRTYSAYDQALPQYPCHVPGALLPAAAHYKIKVILGLWADTEEAYNGDKNEILSVLKANPELKSTIYAFTVGSETLYRHEQDETKGLTVKELLTDIRDFQKATADIGLSVPVGTADSWNKFQDGTADDLINEVGILLVNAFGYWQHQTIKNATATYLDDLQQAFGHIQSISGSAEKPELWNGETGWPTDGGSDYGAAEAGTVNAGKYYNHAVCAALKWNTNAFYFEAFGEPWKPDSLGLDKSAGDEKHWGAFDVNKDLLIDLDCTDYKP